MSMKLRAGAVAALVLALTSCSSSPGPQPTEAPSAAAAAPSAGPNGVADLAPTEILAKTEAAMQTATSVTIDLDDGLGESVIRIGPDGSSGALGGDLGATEIVEVAGTVYVKGEGLAEQLGVAAPADKWVAIPPDDPLAAQFTLFDSPSDFVASSGLLTAETKMTKVGPRDIAGVEAVGLRSKDRTLWVAMSGEPYLVAVTPPSGEPGSAVLRDFNVPVNVVAPPADQVVDVTTLR